MWMPFYINLRLKKVPNFSKTKDLSHKQDWFHHSILPAGISICTCSLTARDYEPEPFHLSTEKCVFLENVHIIIVLSVKKTKTNHTKNPLNCVCWNLALFVTYVNIKRHSHVCACVHVRACMFACMFGFPQQQYLWMFTLITHVILTHS